LLNFGLSLGRSMTKVVNPFVTQWLLAAADKTITLPLPAAGTYDFVVDWGDGTTGIVTAYNDADISHTYTTAGIKTVSIKGKMTHWGFNNGGDKLKITDVLSGGSTGLTSLYGGFHGCSNLKFVANDSEWTKDVKAMNHMFYYCSAFNSDISAWDVSSVKGMSRMFYSCSVFNSDISAWDVSSVTDMHRMFLDCSAFNSDISAWDVSSVTDMNHMFYYCSLFNSDISAWDVSSVTDMHRMFLDCSAFNSDISAWDVSSVTDMNHMFYYCSLFNSDISAWDVSSVTDMHRMFDSCSVFNLEISAWDVSSVTDMNHMFLDCSAFNSDISAWDVSSVTDMTDMLNGANAFSTANYDLLLNAWSSLTLKPNVPFHAGDAKYTITTSQSAHNILTTTPNFWTITDGGGI